MANCLLSSTRFPFSYGFWPRCWGVKGRTCFGSNSYNLFSSRDLYESSCESLSAWSL